MADGPRERLIMSAIDLVRRNGVAGTGLTELLAHSNSARRSIYMHFPGGKDELMAESTRFAGDFIGATIAELAAKHSPTESLALFVDTWRELLTNSGFTAGCPIAAAALAGADASATPVAAEVFAGWSRHVTQQLVAEGVAAETADSLATMAIASIEGAVILAICSRSTTPLDQVQVHLTELVEHHLRVASQG